MQDAWDGEGAYQNEKNHGIVCIAAYKRLWRES